MLLVKLMKKANHTHQAARIIVVDDLPDTLAILTAILAKQGHLVHQANGPEAAIELLGSFQDEVHIMLTDLYMPGVEDGLNLVRQVRELSPHIEIIIMTARPSIESLQDALRTQFVFDYLDKQALEPFQIQGLVERALEHRSIKLQNENLIEQVQIHNEKLEMIVQEQTQELHEAYRSLKASESLKSRFLSTISHELQGPLTPLEGYLELLSSSEMGEVTKEQEAVFQNMLVCVQRLRRQINNVMLLNLLSVSELKLQLEPFVFHDLLFNLQRSLEHSMGECGVSLEFEYNTENDLVYADLHQMSRALLGLIDNLVRVSLRDSKLLITCNNISGKRVQARLESDLEPHQRLFSYLPEVQPDQKFLEITIQSRGLGLNSQQLDDLSKPFGQREHLSQDPATGSFELGLSVALKVMKTHRILFYIESQDNVGMLLSFILPLHQANVLDGPA